MCLNHINYGFRFRPLVFHMVRAFNKVHVLFILNSKLIWKSPKSNHLKLNHYTKTWLRLMYYMNSAENQGFLVRFLTLTVLICYTWRFHQDVSWMLNYWKTIKLSKLFIKLSKLFKFSKFVKLVLNFKIRVYFQFMGLGQFSECGLVYCLIWLRNVINFITIYTIINHPVNRPHHLCVPVRVFSRMREWCVIIGLPVPWVCLLCQHARCARSVPACQRVIPWSVCASLDVSWMFQKSQMSWRPRHCATVPDGSKFTRLYLWLRFICNDDFSVFFSLMWQPIGCVCHH